MFQEQLLDLKQKRNELFELTDDEKFSRSTATCNQGYLPTN